MYWHIKQQHYFNNDNIEYKYKIDDKEYRADVNINDIQLEFQYTDIEIKKIKRRTKEYTKKCKILFWILDYTDTDNEIVIINENIMEINTNNILFKHFTCLYDEMIILMF